MLKTITIQEKTLFVKYIKAEILPSFSPINISFSLVASSKAVWFDTRSPLTVVKFSFRTDICTSNLALSSSACLWIFSNSFFVSSYKQEVHQLTWEAVLCFHIKQVGVKMWNVYFCFFVIISPSKRAGPCIWRNWNPLHPRMHSAKFGWNWPSGSGEEDYKISSMYYQLFSNYLSLEKGRALHLNKLESPLPKDALCQVWFEITSLVLEKTIF